MKKTLSHLASLGLVLAFLNLWGDNGLATPGVAAAEQSFQTNLLDGTPSEDQAAGSLLFLPMVNLNYVHRDMLFISAGEFKMGCDGTNNSGFPCSLDALPLHKVFIDEYYIDKFETTNAMYAVCVSKGSCSPPANFSSLTRPSYYGNSAYDDYPVIHVNWDQAQAYCQWAGKRLPTEAEWEKAARGQFDNRPYPWGSGRPTCETANLMYPGLELCVGDTTPVGSYPDGASAYGVMDMAGNVYEWVYDWYQSDYYSSSPYYNPTGPATGVYKPLKGGAFSYAQDHLILSKRINPFAYQPNEPARTSFLVGFRCVASVER
jgi:eukaryotic-like serine/threonine-protein kinase